MSLTRRNLLTGSAALALSGLFISPKFANAEELKGKSLRVATYGGSWRDSVDAKIVSPLTEEGLAVEYVLGNPDDNLAKIIAARRSGQLPFDVMDGSSLTYPKAHNAGLFEVLDYSRIPNSENAPDWAREEAQVTIAWTGEGIVYNEEEFRKAGIEPPTSYMDLKNPKLRGKVAFPAPSNVHHWGVATALAYENGGSEANMEPAVELIKEIDPSYFFTSSAELATRMGSGDIWAAPLGAGWAVRLKESGLPINVAYPQIGERKGSMWPAPLWVLKDTPNLDAAYSFLAQWFDIDSSATFGAAVGAVPVLPAAREKMAQISPLAAEMLLMDDESVENTFRVKWADLDSDKWRSIWNSRIQG